MWQDLNIEASDQNDERTLRRTCYGVRVALRRSVELYGTRIPVASAPPKKTMNKRAPVFLKAEGRTLRGFLASPAVIVRYSGPATVKAALQTAAKKPSKRFVEWPC